MKPSVELEIHREEIRALIEKYGVTNPRIFGSVARGTDTDDSDLDILVDPAPETSLFELGALHDELSQLLACPVQILTPGDISHHFRAEVLAYAISL